MTQRGTIVRYDDARRAYSNARYIPSSADALGHIVDLSDKLGDGFVSPFRTKENAGRAAFPSASSRRCASGAAAPSAASRRPSASYGSAASAPRSGRAASSAAAGRASRNTPAPRSAVSLVGPGSAYGFSEPFGGGSAPLRLAQPRAGRIREDAPVLAAAGRPRRSASRGGSAVPSWYDDQGFDPSLYGGVPDEAAPSRKGRTARATPSWYEGAAAADDLWADDAFDDAPRSHSAVYTPDDYEEDVRRDAEASGRSKRDERKRAKRKEKADRKFDRQFGADDAGSSAGDGSRAAVYKGEMGSKQRKATRMQRDGANESARTLSRGASPADGPARRVGRALGRIVLVAASVCALCAFLYEPAQQYYQAVREHDRLELEYQVVESRHARLEADLADLQTDSGLEARAHQQLGWVKRGEQTANVRGLDVDASEESLLQANIQSSDIELPRTWYSPILDPLFGVE